MTNANFSAFKDDYTFCINIHATSDWINVSASEYEDLLQAIRWYAYEYNLKFIIVSETSPNFVEQIKEAYHEHEIKIKEMQKKAEEEKKKQQEKLKAKKEKDLKATIEKLKKSGFTIIEPEK